MWEMNESWMISEQTVGLPSTWSTIMLAAVYNIWVVQDTTLMHSMSANWFL